MEISHLSPERQLNIRITLQRMEESPCTQETKDKMQECVLALMLQNYALQDMLKEAMFSEFTIKQPLDMQPTDQ